MRERAAGECVCISPAGKGPRREPPPAGGRLRETTSATAAPRPSPKLESALPIGPFPSLLPRLRPWAEGAIREGPLRGCASTPPSGRGRAGEAALADPRGNTHIFA